MKILTADSTDVQSIDFLGTMVKLYEKYKTNRFHLRIGQTRDVRVVRLITAGSIEENVYLRQVYKQQLSSNAVDGENARRYFNAIQGQAKGELFGIKNLFRVRSGLRCLTDDILRRNEEVEDTVKSRGNRHRYTVVENVLNYRTIHAANTVIWTDF